MRIVAKRNPNYERDKAKKYLEDTDWYVIRFVETKQPIPPEILQERAKARQKL